MTGAETSDEGDGSEDTKPLFHGHWPDPGDPPEGASAAMRSRYATVGYLVDALRGYAASYYSTDWGYAAGYRAGMRKAAQVLVNWVQGRKLWDR